MDSASSTILAAGRSIVITNGVHGHAGSNIRILRELNKISRNSSNGSVKSTISSFKGNLGSIVIAVVDIRLSEV